MLARVRSDQIRCICIMHTYTNKHKHNHACFLLVPFLFFSLFTLRSRGAGRCRAASTKTVSAAK